MDIPKNEPFEARAGDTWQWRREDLSSDYPAPTWTLSYYFKNPTANFNFNAAADGVNFAVTVAKATTAAYAAGRYKWFAFVDNGTQRFEVDRGELEVLPNLAVAGNLDDRTHARKVLEAIEAVIEGRASKDQEEYTIGNRSLKRTPLEELAKMRIRYKQEAAAEEAADRLANGYGSPRKIQIRG
jgi:hypothetical protein